jgi:hypothetical protein
VNPWFGALVVVLALALSVGGGWVTTRLVLKAAARSSDASEEADDEAAGALRGGTWIGLLERLATTGALLLGEPTAVAAIVAVKGLGRFPELKENPAASERFVVGTLASLVWAAGIGYLGRWLLTR